VALFAEEAASMYRIIGRTAVVGAGVTLTGLVTAMPALADVPPGNPPPPPGQVMVCSPGSSNTMQSGSTFIINTCNSTGTGWDQFIITFPNPLDPGSPPPPDGPVFAGDDGGGGGGGDMPPAIDLALDGAPGQGSLDD